MRPELVPIKEHVDLEDGCIEPIKLPDAHHLTTHRLQPRRPDTLLCESRVTEVPWRPVEFEPARGPGAARADVGRLVRWVAKEEVAPGELVAQAPQLAAELRHDLSLHRRRADQHSRQLGRSALAAPGVLLQVGQNGRAQVGRGTVKDGVVAAVVWHKRDWLAVTATDAEPELLAEPVGLALQEEECGQQISAAHCRVAFNVQGAKRDDGHWFSRRENSHPKPIKKPYSNAQGLTPG